MGGRSISPSAPSRAASRARFEAKAAVYSATPTSTGTRAAPDARDAVTPASITALFSFGARVFPSPTVPQTISPDTPSRIRPESSAAVASRSRLSSSLNWVVAAGKTPLQSGFFFPIVALSLFFASHVSRRFPALGMRCSIESTILSTGCIQSIA